MKNEVVIVDYLRSPFSRSRPREPDRDAFNWLRMDVVLGMLYKKLVERTGVKAEEINDVISGCALPVKENWSYGGRFPLFLAELPETVPAVFVEKQCASSMVAIRVGAMEIMTGFSDIVLVGGYEHMTHVPMQAEYMLEFVDPCPDLMSDPRYEKYDLATGMNMGLTAEKLAEMRKDVITKEDMDRWSVESHQKAAKALEEGYFKGEIMPIDAPQADGSIMRVDRDLSIRPDTTLEKIASLPPAFKEDGVITAGNSSPLNAGATAMMLMSRKKAEEYGLKPLASIVSLGWGAVNPGVMGRGPVPASRMALQKAGLKVEDIDYWEINEAFAIVTLNAIYELGIPDKKRVNVKGGAIAIGHPLGASGCRLVGTLARILQEKRGTYGLATPCVGGGQGEAVILKRE
ncbi:MAG: acetyl-CoA C-acetyltransferase [Hadesarchaea archaeon]|nr:MAG: acetyl-CoA C-acetyltransferase [Hadesarchaea archaeon]